MLEKIMLLEVEHLSKEFHKNHQRRKAVQDVSFKLPEGKITAFLGPNGAGKTTTIKLILGLIIKDQGKISFDGQKINNNFSPILSQTGALLEGTRNLYWSMSVLENFKYWGRYKGLTKKDAAKRGIELLNLFNLEDKKNTLVKELSLGMQQIVSICCACLGRPKMLILDEPTLGLDINAVQVMKKVLIKLASVENISIIITTHEMNFAQDVADEMILINHGKVVYGGDLNTALTNFNREIIYQLQFSRDLHKQETNQLQNIGEFTKNKINYEFKFTDINQTPKLLQVLSTLPVININRKKKDLADLLRNYVGD